MSHVQGVPPGSLFAEKQARLVAMTLTEVDVEERVGVTTAKRRRKATVSNRAIPHVRKFLGQRLRELRKQRGFSQERMGKRSSLSGKFIGEVERGEKSISIDSLYKVSVALEVPLAQLTDVRPGRRVVVPSGDAEKIFALVSGRHRRADVRRAYKMLRTMLNGA